MPVLVEDIADVVQTYFASHDKQTFVDIARDRQRSMFAQLFVNNSNLKKEKKKAVEYRVELMAGGYSNTRAKFIDSPDSPSRGTVSSYVSVNMAFQDTNCEFNKMEPAFASGGDYEIINYLDLHKQNMYDRWFEFQDNILFTLPTAPNDSPPLFWSVPYYVVPYTTGNVGFGFNGPNPSGYSSVLTKNRSLNENAGLRNGTGEFGTVDQMDFCKIAAEAYQKCGFKPYYTVGKDRAREEVADGRFHFFSDFELYQQYQDIAYTSNDNTGQDQGVYRKGRGGDNVFMSSNWSWVPARLDNGSETEVIGTRYFYGLDLSTWELDTYGEWFMREDKPITMSDSHNMLVVYMDSGFQLVCKNPRANFVIVPAQ